MTGWIYLACLIVTIGAVAMALQVSLPQISNSFQIVGTSTDAKSVAMNAIFGFNFNCYYIINPGIKLLVVINNMVSSLNGLESYLIVLLFLNSTSRSKRSLNEDRSGSNLSLT
jgi:hypothetical protein